MNRFIKKAIKRIAVFFNKMDFSRNNSLVVVCGCTCTGKTDLGVAISTKFSGEVISADSMQIYRGLDITSNKVTKEEMCGIPHHMLSFYDPSDSDYNVHRYRSEVIQLLEQMWGENVLPVIVGGTAYYIESVLYQSYLIDTDPGKSERIREDLRLKFPTNDLLYEELVDVDPISAKHLHRNDCSRIIRALEVFYSTGRRKSDFINEYREKQLGCLRFSRVLLIYLDADKRVLDKRLDDRVDKMIEQGLVQELEDFYNRYKEKISAGSFGVMQNIGLKEFWPYLQLSEDGKLSTIGQETFKKCCERMKLHTRQYSRRQRNWLLQRLLLRKSTREVPEFICLDTSINFHKLGIPFAIECVENFLHGIPILYNQQPSNSPFREETLDKSSILLRLPSRPNAPHLSDPDYNQLANKIYTCQQCNIEVKGHINWQKHLSGKRHAKNRNRDIGSDASSLLNGNL